MCAVPSTVVEIVLGCCYWQSTNLRLSLTWINQTFWLSRVTVCRFCQVCSFLWTLWSCPLRILVISRPGLWNICDTPGYEVGSKSILSYIIGGCDRCCDHGQSNSLFSSPLNAGLSQAWCIVWESSQYLKYTAKSSRKACDSLLCTSMWCMNNV